MAEPGRTNPESILQRLVDEQQAGSGRRGALHVYLGAAPGVGKTWSMLSEGRRLAASGVDVVCGLIESHGRVETEDQIDDLECVPRQEIPYRGVVISEMDTDAILRRNPRVCLVDELAHTNAPGCERETRWQDVEVIRDAGIDVLTTLNVQHLESLNDIVESITGVRVRETVPDWLLDDPTIVHLVDFHPEGLRQRLREGKIYPPDRARAAIDNFFQTGNLTALREIALRQVAVGVETSLEKYMTEHQIVGPWAATETVLACFGSGPLARQVLRHAWREARGLNASLLAVHVTRTPLAQLPDHLRRPIERDTELAEDLGAEVIVVQDSDTVAAILGLARRHNVTQIVIGHSRRPRWHEILGKSLVTELIRRSHGVDIHVVAGNRDGITGEHGG